MGSLTQMSKSKILAYFVYFAVLAAVPVLVNHTIATPKPTVFVWYLFTFNGFFQGAVFAAQVMKKRYE